jgi:hypothetical protein
VPETPPCECAAAVVATSTAPTSKVFSILASCLMALPVRHFGRIVSSRHAAGRLGDVGCGFFAGQSVRLPGALEFRA